ncbi:MULTISPECIES: rod-binding protein [unclassified Brevundimonas]|uniref:rod-binding protein n=1 Tax=unclassified Brevundimonas TaxID=2622653 RepID=UPI0025BE2B32|nr:MULTISPECIES: rod-binding protein [unclassified Brevundimonas]
METNPLNALAIQSAGRLGRPEDDASHAQMRRVAVDFEATLLSQMLKPMFEGLKSDGPFGGGAGEEMWRGFLVEEMGKQAARSGGIGLADKVMAHMLKAQEGLV